MSRRNVLSFDDQGPVRSGLPSGVRGAGANRFGLPSAVRGTFGGGTLIQFCARTGADMTSTAMTKAPADPYTRRRIGHTPRSGLAVRYILHRVCGLYRCRIGLPSQAIAARSR